MIDVAVEVYVIKESDMPRVWSLSDIPYTKENLIDTIPKTFELEQRWVGRRYGTKDSDIKRVILEISSKHKIKKRMIKCHISATLEDGRQYEFIEKVRIVMNDKYYYLWKAKWRNIRISEVLN